MTMGPVWAPHFIDVIADQEALSASATQTDITTLTQSLSLYLLTLSCLSSPHGWLYYSLLSSSHSRYVLDSDKCNGIAVKWSSGATLHFKFKQGRRY